MSTSTKTECEDKLQRVVDGPYDRWQAHEALVMAELSDGKITHAEAMDRAWSFRDVITKQCNELERKAMVLGKFYGEVCNGGLLQWSRDNGYAEESWDILEPLLAEMAKTYSASRVVHETCCNFMWEFGRTEDDSVLEEAEEQYTNMLYSFFDDFIREVCAYLKI